MATSTSLADKVKIWLFPSLMGILGMLIWSDLQTIKTNLATALTQTTTDKANIENLNNRVNRLENFVYKTPLNQDDSNKQKQASIPTSNDTLPTFQKIVATKPDEREIIVKVIPKKTL
jgi:hypothetical protein